MIQAASTTIVESWSGADLAQLGPIYPFVGGEFVLWIAGLVFWIGFHVLQARIERRELEADAQAARDQVRLSRVLEEEGDGHHHPAPLAPTGGAKVDPSPARGTARPRPGAPRG